MSKKINIFAVVREIVRSYLEELTFIQERDEALYIAYVNALRRPDVKSHQQAIEIAINSPTSQFWISPLRAYREILWCKNGKRVVKAKDHHKRLIEDLYAEYLRLSDKPMFRGCSTLFVSQFAVCSNSAKGFYISRITAKRIINRKRREKGCRWW